MAAALSVVASDGPAIQAAIQAVPVLVSDIRPPFQVWQLEHATLAVMPSAPTPLPARSVRRAAVLLPSRVGMVCGVPRRGDKVRLPFPSWYIKNMFEPDMAEPVPNATHWNVAGALI